MGKLSVTSIAENSVAIGSHLEAAKLYELGKIDSAVTWKQSGTGSGDYEATKQHYTKYTNVTGVQTLDLNALVTESGGTLNLATVREITISNQATNPAHVIIVGAAATTPFVGPFGGTTPTIKVEPGETKVIACKPLGSGGYPTTGANNLKLDFGANTFSAEVIIKGN